ncbi:MAG: hypothetical protein IPJ21_09505 [Sterolibacteriaceae bacterium]|nr:hypothetical protein [Sterolibacteriaceae bacterium]MBK9084100.1 hypothetical protein [Sterolibacteriaceae bacterium]
MDTYEALIRQEEAKLTLLRQKVVACEQRIAALRTLAQTDDVDDAIATAVGRVVQANQASMANVAAPAAEAATSARGDGRQVRKDSVVIEVLSYLRGGVRTLDEVEDHLKTLGEPRSRGYLRTALMTWRKSNGWVTNPKPGRYGLTDEGTAFVDANKGEGPGASTPRPSR